MTDFLTNGSLLSVKPGTEKDFVNSRVYCDDPLAQLFLGHGAADRYGLDVVAVSNIVSVEGRAPTKYKKLGFLNKFRKKGTGEWHGLRALSHVALFAVSVTVRLLSVVGQTPWTPVASSYRTLDEGGTKKWTCVRQTLSPGMSGSVRYNGCCGTATTATCSRTRPLEPAAALALEPAAALALEPTQRSPLGFHVRRNLPGRPFLPLTESSSLTHWPMPLGWAATQRPPERTQMQTPPLPRTGTKIGRQAATRQRRPTPTTDGTATTSSTSKRSKITETNNRRQSTGGKRTSVRTTKLWSQQKLSPM